MNAEFDLSPRFLALHRVPINNWLEAAIPGQTLCIHLSATPAASPFVSSSAIERNTVVLALTQDRGEPRRPHRRPAQRTLEARASA